MATAPALKTQASDQAPDQVTVHVVMITGFVFEPQHLEARVGDTIRWINQDLAPHTATADELGWDTKALRQGESGEVLVTKGMEQSYFCAFHPHMMGTFEIL